MKKLPIKQLPDAFIKWSETLEDFWLGKFIRSTGYTKKEIGELAKKHKEIDRAVKLAVDSLFDKAFYKVIAGEIKPTTAVFLLFYYGQELNLIKPRDSYKYKYENSGINDFSKWDDEKPVNEQENKVEFYDGNDDDPFIKIEKY